MAKKRTSREQELLTEILSRDHSLHGGVLHGLDGYIIEIQARALEVLRGPAPWRSATKITGMALGSVRESLSRISGAFKKYQIPDPEVEILINLAPADLPKEGTWLDLPLAIIMLQAAGMLPDLPERQEKDYILMGELGIHGEVRRVPGALSLAFEAKAGQKLIVPHGNEKECALIMAKPGHDGCGVYAVDNLLDVINFFKGNTLLTNALKGGISFEQAIPKAVDFSKIKGQQKAKDAAMISAAGGHNMLLIGPPGEGKSLIANAIPGILPKLTDAEKVQLTKIYSACGELEEDGQAVMRRPMRSVHHTASVQAVIGGGSKIPRPGEITLAHLGVLFLDEIAEFSRGTLESLRQPIESGEVSITRVQARITYPCQFTLVAAMNPCPCGYYPREECKCKESAINKYQKKLSGPILDRIDLQVELKKLTIEERFQKTKAESSRALRQKIEKARTRQVERFEGTEIPFNSAIPGGHVAEFCDFSSSGLSYFKRVIEESSLSTRSMDRLAKVARTVADIHNDAEILERHIDEAKSFVVGGILRAEF